MTMQREMPHNEEAEQALVGGCMLDPVVMDGVLLTIHADMIYHSAPRIVFAAMIELHNANKPIDIVTLSRVLKAKKLLKEVGGAEFLNELMGAVPHTAHVDYYAEIVRGEWIRREALKASQSVQDAMYDPTFSPEEAIAAGDRAMIELVESLDRGADCQGIGDILLRLEENWNDPSPERSGLPGHVGCLTDIVGGFAPGNLIVIAARPSVGKTAFALNLIDRWCRNGTSTLFFSLEQSQLEIGERMLSIHIGASISDMLNKRVDHLQFESARSDMVDWPLVIDDRGSPSILQIESISRLFKRKKDIKAIVIDYLQLVIPSDRKMPREQQVAEISGRLKTLAKSLGIPVIVLAQLNRQSESRDNKRPRLSDLRESGAVEQDADKVILLWRQFMDEAGHKQADEAVAIVAKNRNGPTGDAEMVYRKHCFQFVERVNSSIEAAMEFSGQTGNDW